VNEFIVGKNNIKEFNIPGKSIYSPANNVFSARL